MLISAEPEVSPLSALRQATREAHDRVEARVAIDVRFATRSGYRGLLGGFLGLLEPLEPRLEAVLKSVPGAYVPSGRCAMAEADLRLLGLAPDEIVGLPRARVPAAISSPGFALGCQYVVEGSALGGPTLARMAYRQLGIERSSGGSFFAGPENLGPRWRAVAASINTLAQSAGPPEVTAGARHTFAWIEDWLCR
jgi:heme oxygenase